MWNQAQLTSAPRDITPAVPRDPSIDMAIGAVFEGYNYMPRRFRRFGTDLFLTRMLGQRAICIHGAEAARFFYDESKMQRSGAIPRRVVTSLFGKNAVHTLDDHERAHRKAAFLDLMTEPNLRRLTMIASEQWRAAIHRWEGRHAIVLFDEVAQLLCRSICQWAGVPLVEEEVPQRASDFVAMIDSFGGIGPRLWRGKLARHRAQKWIMPLIKRARVEGLNDSQRALDRMAQLRGLNGELLDLQTAAVELINVLRPTVAITWYVTFAALSLHRQQGAAQMIREERFGEHAGPLADAFMQEVRRFYPFAPFLGAMVRTPFEWKGYPFEPGTLVLMDIYGTNHDGRRWLDPDTFKPERFMDQAPTAYDFLPQGGGSHAGGHRCPGEWVTMHNLTLAVHYLTRCMRYEVDPSQDFGFSLRRMPTFPRSRMVIRRVQSTAALEQPAPTTPSAAAECIPEG